MSQPKGGIKETEASVLQETIAKLTKQMDHLKVSGGTSNPQSNSNNNGHQNGQPNSRNRKCFHCNSKEHVQFDCPTMPSWRKDGKPTDNGPKDRTVESTLYKWCEKCNAGKSFWMTGRISHTTVEHRSRWKKPQTTTTTTTAPEPEAGLMGIILSLIHI